MRFMPVGEGGQPRVHDDAWANHTLRRDLSRADRALAEMHGQLHLSGLKHAHDTKLIAELCKELDECERQLDQGSAQLQQETRARKEAEAELQREKRAREEAEAELQQERRARAEAEAQMQLLWQHVLQAQQTQQIRLVPSQPQQQIRLVTSQPPQPPQPQPPQPKQPRQPPRKKGRR